MEIPDWVVKEVGRLQLELALAKARESELLERIKYLEESAS